MTFLLQLLLYLACFVLCIQAAAKKGAVQVLFFYPEPVQEKVYASGIIDRKTVSKNKKRFFVILMLEILLLPVLFIGIWSRVTEFQTAFWQVLVLLEAMNWFDGIFIDLLWVARDPFWKIEEAGNLEYVKSLSFVLKQRILASFVYIPAAALLAWICVLTARLFG